MRIISLTYLLIMNFIAFGLYGIDKYKAVKHRWRISENTLIMISFAGGSCGAFFGMLLFRHKTRIIKFRILVPLSVFLWIFILYFNFR